MAKELERLLQFMRPAFSRGRTHVWFVIAFVGFLVRYDNLGVTSIVRALCLTPVAYMGLLNFFHSTAWETNGLMSRWWEWLKQRDVAYRMGDRLVLAGDHTKTPKDGRKVPAVTTLHQDSETASKPTFFRGHHWGAVALVVRACSKYFAVPVWARIHEGLEGLEESGDVPKTIRIVQMGQQVAMAMGSGAYLVLDAYFAVGPVFETAKKELLDDELLVHILTRAKKNVVAFRPAPPPKKRRNGRKKRGRKKKYGEKLKLMKLFDSKAKALTFQEAEACVYGKQETIRYLTLDLLWKPIKGMLRFILVESSRGRMVLITSDFDLSAVAAVQLYCRRVSIETMFDTLKNLLGGLGYHFWSQYLSPASRQPKKKGTNRQRSSNLECTRNTLMAIEKFVNLQLLVLGALQMIAKLFPQEVKSKARCWLRTVSSNTPSEFVTRMALANIIKTNLAAFAKDWITQLILQKQEKPGKDRLYRKVA